MTRRSCGTCALWGAEDYGGYRQCTWQPPLLPFWANIDRGSDHDDSTAAEQGKWCPTWVAKPEEK